MLKTKQEKIKTVHLLQRIIPKVATTPDIMCMGMVNNAKPLGVGLPSGKIGCKGPYKLNSTNKLLSVTKTILPFFKNLTKA
jgi:hypothetical protein